MSRVKRSYRVVPRLTTGMDESGSSSSREKHYLETTDVSSLFLLKGELYRKLDEQRQKATVSTTKVSSKKVLLLFALRAFCKIGEIPDFFVGGKLCSFFSAEKGC